MSRIEPTIGRIVHYYDFDGSGPYAAILTAVLDQNLVRVRAFDVKDGVRGHNDVNTDVPLLQDGDTGIIGAYATWMPYQIGQAKKTEEAIASAAAAMDHGRAVCAPIEPLPAGVQRIQPRSKVEPIDLDNEIAAGEVIYSRIEGTTITHCAIVLANGFSVTGESACVDPAEFNEQTGREIAFKNAREKLWPLLGFRLADERMRMRGTHGYIVEQGALSDAQLEELTKPGLVVAGPSATLGG